MIAVYGQTDGVCHCHKGHECPSPGKHPIGEWRTNPREPGDGDNYGTVTGDGFWVLDIDPKNGGVESFAALVKEHGTLPETRTVITGSGGCHYYFLGDGVHNSASKVGPGIDVRGIGGMVVAPPSTHASGGVYSWLAQGPMAKAPAWLRDLVMRPRTSTKGPTDSQIRDARSSVRPLDRLIRAESYAKTMPSAKEGEGGDAQTYSVARVGYAFGVEEESWFKWMLVHYNPTCTPPWREKDLRVKVSNGYTYPSDPPFGWRLVSDKPEKKSVEEEGGLFYVLESVSDLDIAQAWIINSGRDLLNVEGSLYEYNVGCWTIVEPSAVMRWVGAEIHGAFADVKGKFDRLALSRNKQKAISAAIVDYVPDMTLEQFEADRRLGLATVDHTWLIERDGSLVGVAHSKEHPVTQFLPVDLTEPQPIDRWLKFLSDVFEGDSEKVDFIQEFVGTAACGYATHFAKSVWLLGEGSNGKSTLLDVIKATLFDPARLSFSPPHSWRDPYSRIQMRTALLNIVSEIADKNLFNSEETKAIISGDTTKARNLHQSFVAFNPRAGHIFAANKLPAVADSSKGFWRRVVVIKMDRAFKEVAGNRYQILSDIMEHERAGVVRWALEGAARASKRGDYLTPAETTAALEEWREDSDTVAGFISSCCGEGEFVSVSELYRSYAIWYSDQTGGDSPKIHKRRFSRKIGDLGHTRARTKTDRGFRLSVVPIEEWKDYGLA